MMLLNQMKFSLTTLITVRAINLQFLTNLFLNLVQFSRDKLAVETHNCDLLHYTVTNYTSAAKRTCII